MKNRHYNFAVILFYSILAGSIILALIGPGRFGKNFGLSFFIGTTWAAIINSASLIARICDKLEEGMHHHIDVMNINTINAKEKEDAAEQ